MPRTSFSHKRLASEFKTIGAMIAIFCENRHGSAGGRLCPECRELREYAKKRLLLCPFQEEKPTCGNCAIHCYKKDMRGKIKAVMRHAGPRMSYRHPAMALRHLLDSRRRTPARKNRRDTSP